MTTDTKYTLELTKEELHDLSAALTDALALWHPRYMQSVTTSDSEYSEDLCRLVVQNYKTIRERIDALT